MPTKPKKNPGGAKRSDLPVGVRPNAFALWMKESEKSVEDVAELLHCTTSAVYGYRRGDRPPSRKMAVQIELITGGEVKPGSWD